MEEPGRLQSLGSLGGGHDCATSLPLFLSCIGEGNGNPLQYSCLENHRDGGAWWAAVYVVAQSRTWLKRLSSSNSNIFTSYFLFQTTNSKGPRKYYWFSKNLFDCARSQFQQVGSSLPYAGSLVEDQDPGFLTRDVTGTPALGAQSPNHWTTRGSPWFLCLLMSNTSPYINFLKHYLSPLIHQCWVSSTTFCVNK